MNIASGVIVRILFFAKARELSGHSDEKLSVPPILSVSELLNVICEKYSLQAIRQSIILAVNEEYCDVGETQLELRDGDEIAIIPPISGG